MNENAVKVQLTNIHGIVAKRGAHGFRFSALSYHSKGFAKEMISRAQTLHTIKATARFLRIRVTTLGCWRLDEMVSVVLKCDTRKPSFFF